ncbi:MAG: adenylate kinase [Ilumatobacter sp.]|uniref:adenylate kinase n=1 Tax=Ilumatobacter sp. TaxID=1967498 RepID=UPI00262E616E|nr:adenylate kinase [Ilumatobacter sp.]MDJ0771023.1 adenylate kinase [Ilumatobacter sp.]
MIPGARIIILGRQGAGKGTQCVRLSRHYVVPHISTGDMLRAAAREGSELGLAAKEVMDAGGLVGDEIMIGLVAERLEKADATTRGFILDGFPRTVKQATALDRITAQQPIHVVIDLDVPREIVLERLSSRRVCRDCGTNYTAAGQEPSPWICDVCGGDVQQRADDTPDSVNRRLDLYETQTSPLIDYFSSRGALTVVNGVGHPDHVFKRLTDSVEARR